MTTSSATLVLRLAAPLQSWGAASQFNRRETASEPTKSGITGLLAAAQGRRRADPIEDLVGLLLGVRTDQHGTLLRDYHTVSDYRPRTPLLSAGVNKSGKQKRATLPKGYKYTHITQRYYLQDAVFVAVLRGPVPLTAGLAAALRRPAFPLALGRRSCPPTQPLVLHPTGEHAHDSEPDLWAGDVSDTLAQVPWQASSARLEQLRRFDELPAEVHLPVIYDDPSGNDVRTDVPTSFAPTERRLRQRRVRTGWVRVASPVPSTAKPLHDPFALLGW